MTIEFSKPLQAQTTPIPGVVLYDLPVHGDNRGWFKENWQREKMIALGLPDFRPVQNNISFNEKAGTTRGIHAEPWDKFISVATGRIFGAWVDLREGPSFGAVFTAELDASQAIFIPRGVGNAFQTLEDNTAYTYLVNDHWSADAQGQYTFLNLADESAAIQWPIPLDKAELSDKDKAHPRLADVLPMAPKKTLVLGADGQLGKALRAIYEAMTRSNSRTGRSSIWPARSLTAAGTGRTTRQSSTRPLTPRWMRLKPKMGVPQPGRSTSMRWPVSPASRSSTT
jgi:dTDP-4-dehydrorhamnose 3,5-epimerase